jgi:hypothetical protein
VACRGRPWKQTNKQTRQNNPETGFYCGTFVAAAADDENADDDDEDQHRMKWSGYVASKGQNRNAR